jgi:hypothetical protein
VRGMVVVASVTPREYGGEAATRVEGGEAGRATRGRLRPQGGLAGQRARGSGGRCRVCQVARVRVRARWEQVSEGGRPGGGGNHKGPTGQ